MRLGKQGREEIRLIIESRLAPDLLKNSTIGSFQRRRVEKRGESRSEINDSNGARIRSRLESIAVKISGTCASESWGEPCVGWLASVTSLPMRGHLGCESRWRLKGFDPAVSS